jgi:hypothetical protein
VVADTEPIPIVEERRLAGPAATLEGLPEDQDPEASAEELARILADQDAAVPGDRSPISYLVGLVGRLRSRKLVRDLGVHESRVGWLEFHVPPGGSAKLVLGRTETGGGGIDLKLMGLGFGSGLEMKTAEERDFGERTRCFTLGSLLRVHLREFAEGTGQSTIQVDVVDRVGNYVEAHDVCPLCFTAPHPGPQPRLTDDTWDLAGDPHGLTTTRRYDLSTNSEVEVGLDVPLPLLTNLTAALAVSRSVKSTCEATYVLQGGHVFSAYSELEPGLGLPFWGRD